MRQIVKVNINGEFNHIVIDDLTLAEAIVKVTTDGGVGNCYGSEKKKLMKKLKLNTLGISYLKEKLISQLLK